MTVEDFSTPRRAKRYLNLTKENVKKLQLKNRCLRRKNSVLLKKIVSLKGVINVLKKNNCLSEDAADTIMVTYIKFYHN